MRGVRAGVRAGGGHAPRQAQRERQVGQFGLTVGAPAVVSPLAHRVVEVDRRPERRPARDRHDPRLGPPEQSGKQQADEREVPEVIHPELHLEAVLGESPWQRHHAGVGDHQVDPAVRHDPLGERPHGRQRRQVEHFHPHGGVGYVAQHVVPSVLAATAVTAGEHDVCPARGQEAHRLAAQAGVAAGDHRRLPTRGRELVEETSNRRIDGHIPHRVPRPVRRDRSPERCALGDP